MKNERGEFDKVLAFAVLFAMLALVSVGSASAVTIYVPDDYAKIQWAVDNATTGDTIIVKDGTYVETVKVKKRLTLKSENGYTNCFVHPYRESENGYTNSFFPPPKLDDVFVVTASYVNISGFTIGGITGSYSGVCIERGDHCIVSDNNFLNNTRGIYIVRGRSNNNTIQNNYIRDNGAGIYIDGSNSNTIRNNYIRNNGKYGIEIRYSSNNTIQNNYISDNGDDGIFLGYESGNNIITGNVFVNDGLFVGIYYHGHIVENNTVNGKPLVYLENVSDVAVKNAGQVILVRCRNVTVENLDLSDTTTGIELRSTDGCNVRNNTVSNNNGVGIRLYYSDNNTIWNNGVGNNNGSGIYLYYSNNNTIWNNDDVINDGDGIALSHSDGNTIRNNDISNSGDDGIYLYQSDSNTIQNNDIGNSSDDGVYLKNFSNNNILRNNNISNSDGDGISLSSYSNNNTIQNNDIRNSRRGGILISAQSSNNIITGNVFVDDGLLLSSQNIVENNTVNGKPLVYLENVSDVAVKNAGQVILVRCRNVTVENLDLSNTTIGIELMGADDCNIQNNIVRNCNDGIYLHHAYRNTIQNNNIRNNGGGIYLNESSSNNIIQNNDIHNSGNDGIYLTKLSSNNIIQNNDIHNNGDDGIVISHSSNNIIRNNDIRNNGDIGINIGALFLSMLPSSNNYIYLNNFIGNTRNARSSDFANLWNSSTPITYTYNDNTYTNYLGNYWDNYTGIDADDDGIGDAPYRIDSDNNDTYPLMNTWENRISLTPPSLHSTYTTIPPTIDGVISPAEWINPIPITLNGFNNPESTRSGTLHIMNSNSNLYIAAVIPDNTQTNDYLLLDFDTSHDYIATDGEEDAAGFNVGSKYSSFGFTSGYDDANWNEFWWGTDAEKHGSGARGYTSGNYIYEFSKPLNSGDSQDMDISPGGAIGFRIETWDNSLNDWYRYPQNTVDADTSRWDEWTDIIIATS